MISSNTQAGIFRSSSHPLVLAALYFFRSAALAVYVLCGLFTDNYVLSVGRRGWFDALDRLSWLNLGLSDTDRSSSWSFSFLSISGTSRFVPDSLVVPAVRAAVKADAVDLMALAECRRANSGRLEVLERSRREWRFSLGVRMPRCKSGGNPGRGRGSRRRGRDS